METTYFVALNLKSTEGYECFGKFFLGKDPGFAKDVFSRLKGSSTVKEDNVLQLDLTELKGNLPSDIEMLSCTLDELTENCKIITKETFKHLNLI